MSGTGAYGPNCRWCGSKAGQPCTDSRGGHLTSGYIHEERREDAKKRDLRDLRRRLA
jgi:hypothetical protein